MRWQQLMATGGRNCAKLSRPQRSASRVRCFLAVVRFATLLIAVAAGLLELSFACNTAATPDSSVAKMVAAHMQRESRRAGK